MCSICAVSICVVTYTALGTKIAVWMFYPDPRMWWRWSLLGILSTSSCFILLVVAVEDLKLQI
jgi:O-antigen ligase